MLRAVHVTRAHPRRRHVGSEVELPRHANLLTASVATVTSHLRTFLLGTAHVERERILVAGAVRTAVLTLVLVSIAIYAGHPNAGIPLSIGVLFAALAEAGEEVGRRWRTMLWTTLWLMAASLVGGLVSENAIAVVIASTVIAFGAGLAGAAGPRAAVGGVFTLVVFIVYAGDPELPGASLESALLIGLGGVILTVVTILPAIVRDPSVMRVALSAVPPLWPRIREHVVSQDMFLRHAVRLSIVILAATILSEASGVPHAYWLPMTVAWVTKPDVSGTVSKVAARVLGTILGLALGALLLMGLGVSGYWAALVVALAGGIAVAFVWANYAVGVAGITVFVVVMFSFDGDSVPEDLVLRLLATLLAAVMAIAGSFIWRAPATT